MDYVFQHALEPDRNWEFIIIRVYCCYPGRKILNACILSWPTWSLQVLNTEVCSPLSSPEKIYLTRAAWLVAHSRKLLNGVFQKDLKPLVIPKKPVWLPSPKRLEKEQHFESSLPPLQRQAEGAGLDQKAVLYVKSGATDQIIWISGDVIEKLEWKGKKLNKSNVLCARIGRLRESLVCVAPGFCSWKRDFICCNNMWLCTGDSWMKDPQKNLRLL